MKGKLNGLDLFSGIGGIGLALNEWVRTIAYCEQDRYAQGVLLSRMQSGDIDRAPIFNDVCKLRAEHFITKPDIIFGGFPCQDISVAGNGVGLDGDRSGLFFQVARLIEEIQPVFVFLENVPAIRTRGLDVVLKELAALGYDCRWTTISAASVGANHKRDRWFLLAHTNNRGRWKLFQQIGERRSEKSSNTRSNGKIQSLGHSKHNGHTSTTITGSDGTDNKEESSRSNSSSKSQGTSEYRNVSRNISNMANSNSLRKLPEQRQYEGIGNGSKGVGYDSLCERLEGQWEESFRIESQFGDPFDRSWWHVEPPVGRVVNGLQNRVDRIKCLGNSVVPLQVKTAFEKLLKGCSE